jgi:glycosyltransferase involved in cell wall biosynthesis
MRIAMMTDSFHPELGGIQDSIMTICRELGARGHQICLLAPAAAARDFSRAGLSVGEVDLGPNVRIERCPAVPVAGSTGQSRLVLPTGRRWRALIEFRPELIHAQTFFGLGIEAITAARRLDVPLIGTNHWAIGAFSGYFPLPASWFRALSERAVTAFYNRCDQVYTPSHAVLDTMRAAGLARPSGVISNPIDTGNFCPPDAAVRPALRERFGMDGRTIIYAGRLAREKHIEVLIRALAQVLAQIPDAMLALAGHGSDRARLERLAATLGIGHRVRFLGTLSQADLAQAFQAADLFAIASTSESQSMVLLQAMSTGLPAVAARARALPEYVTPSCGLLAMPGDSDDFARHLGTLLSDAQLRRDMGGQAHAAAARYDTAAIASQWESLYSTLCHSPIHPSRESMHEAEPDHPRL